MLKTYPGSCHCGAVTFEVDIDLAQPTYRCNYSIWRQTRFWAAVARQEGFRLLTGESELIRYVFNTKKNFLPTLRRTPVRRWQQDTYRQDVRRQRGVSAWDFRGSAFRNSHHLYRWEKRPVVAGARVRQAFVMVCVETRRGSAMLNDNCHAGGKK
mgnify:CR=1 FL=1